jgi:tellurite resistance protein TerA
MPISLKRKEKPEQVITTLHPGSTYDVDKTLDPAKTINLEISARGYRDVDFACFSVDAGNRAREQFFIFHGQTGSPGNEISLKDGGSHAAQFRLELSRLPGEIKKLIFTASAADPESTLNISGLYLTVSQNNAGFNLRLFEDDLVPHKSLIVAELALNSHWQLEAPVRGFDGHLGDLANHFGLEVEEEPSPNAHIDEPVVQGDGKIWIDGEEFAVDPETDWV